MFKTGTHTPEWNSQYLGGCSRPALTEGEEERWSAPSTLRVFLLSLRLPPPLRWSAGQTQAAWSYRSLSGVKKNGHRHEKQCDNDFKPMSSLLEGIVFLWNGSRKPLLLLSCGIEKFYVHPHERISSTNYVWSFGVPAEIYNTSLKGQYPLKWKFPGGSAHWLGS